MKHQLAAATKRKGVTIMGKYYAKIDNGQGGDTYFDADSIESAMDMARDWADEGDWPEEGCKIRITVEDEDEDEELEEYYDIITPEPEADDHDHEWTSENEGGCDQNPGCWDTGNGSMVFVDHCKICGMKRRHVSKYANQINCEADDTYTYEDDPEYYAKYCVD